MSERGYWWYITYHVVEQISLRQQRIRAVRFVGQGPDREGKDIVSERHRNLADLDARTLASSVCRFTAFADLSEADFKNLAAIAKGRRSLGRGEFVCHEGASPAGLFLLLKGWTVSSVTFANGARQLLKVHLPGDVLGMPSLALRQCADSIVALTPVELGIISRHELGRMFENSPRLAALLFLISQEERVATMDRLASVGATEALHSLAALLLQIHARVLRYDPDIGDAFDMPLSQDDIAALIGVTPVHLNRTVQHLRQDGLIAWTRHRVSILDRNALLRLAGLPERELDREADWLPGTPRNAFSGNHAPQQRPVK